MLKSMAGLQKRKVAEFEQGALFAPRSLLGAVVQGVQKGGAIRANMKSVFGIGRSNTAGKSGRGVAGAGVDREGAAADQALEDHAQLEALRRRQARLALLLGSVPTRHNKRRQTPADV